MCEIKIILICIGFVDRVKINLTSLIKKLSILAEISFFSLMEAIKMHYDYKTHGTCSQIISFDIDGDVIRNIKFTGGCNGNLKAIARLVDGYTVEEIEKKLKGVECGQKGTSCGDQLARAVREAFEAQKK